MGIFLSQFTKFKKVLVVFLGLGVIFLFIFYFIFFTAPRDFPYGQLVHVERNSSLTQIAHNLKSDHIITSEILFKVFVVLQSKKHKVVEGDYYFTSPANVQSVAKRISHGDYGMTPTKITFPEGSNNATIANLISQKIQGFDQKKFLELADEKEGYLFPDTYFFFQNTTPERVIESMSTNFAAKIKTLEPNIHDFNKPLKDVITMASILEEEANSADSRRIISGILWKRIEQGIPLQVDSTFIKVNGKKSSELSLKDLTIDSPYNTYKYPGLPAGPITNPGLDAILAAISPIKTDYLYFLSDSKGNIYYAKTFAEHIENRKKYLNQ